MSTRQHTLLGLFFLAVTSVLGYFTLFRTDFSLWGERFGADVWSVSAGGLRNGDPVLVAGVRWGKVEDVIYDPAPADPRRRVRVTLRLDRPMTLYTDHAIVIRDATVLGGKNLVIEPGSPEAGPYEGELFGQVAPDVLTALGDVVAENRDAIRNTIAGLEELVGDARDGKGVLGALISDEALRQTLEDAVTNVNSTFANLEDITGQLASGEGTIGKLIYDQALYQQIDDLASSLKGLVDEGSQVIADVRAGKGTVGMLLYDEETAADVKAAVADIRDVTGRLSRGEGSIGQLLTDPAVADNLKVITANLAEGRGTLGLLINEPEIYEDVRAITADLRTFSSALASGDGTISKLVYEDELYAELDRALRVLTGTLEEAREAAPISNFLNTLFLGF